MGIIITNLVDHIQVDLGTGADVMLFPKSVTTIWHESSDDKVYFQTTRTSYGVDYTNITSPSVTDNDALFELLKGYVDTTNISTDAFSRLRVSDANNRFDAEFTFDTLEEIVDEVINGSSTIAHQTNTRDVLLSVVATGTGDNAALYSYPVPYTPGSSQLIDLTGVLDYAAIGGGTAQVFLRSKISGSVAETVINQTSWDNPVADVNWTFSQIFAMDFQSLKVGRIRFYLNRDGNPVKVHEIVNDNIRNSGYWQTPNQPVYWRIYNDATYTYMEIGYGDTDNAIGFRYRVAKNANAEMVAICGTVKSEGGNKLFELDGYPQTANSGTTTKTVAATEIPLLSIRALATFKSIPNNVLIIPKQISIQTNNPILLRIYHDATLTGASWNDVDTTHSVMEFDVAASAFSGGHVILSEYVATSKNVSASVKSILGKAVLWNRRNGNTGILTITAVRTTTTSADVLTVLNWEEIR